MKLEITREVKKTETIDIEFPYYYKHDLSSDEEDVVIYGKIDEKKHTSIKIGKRYWDQSIEFELEIEERGAASLACYMTDEHKSSETEYNAAKNKLLAAASGDC